jgi:hypothetical protein
MGWLNHREETPSTKKVIHAITIAPSFWPLLFAGILGNTFKALAHWKLERGTRLGILEQLLGSQTVAGTLRTSFSLRSFGFCTATLTLLWVFNPLGSQAVLRAVNLHGNFQTGTRLVQHLNTSTWAYENTVLQGYDYWLYRALRSKCYSLLRRSRRTRRPSIRILIRSLSKILSPSLGKRPSSSLLHQTHGGM